MAESGGGLMAERVRHKRRYRIRPRFFIFLVAIVALAWFGWNFISFQINQSMVDTVVVESGVIVASVDVDFVISRKGTIVRSPNAGAAKPLVKEGERVSKDTPILQIVNEEQAKESDTQLASKKAAREKMVKEWKTTDSKFQQQIEEIDKKARGKIEAIAALPEEENAKADQLQDELNLLFKEGQRLTAIRSETSQAHKVALTKLDKEISELNAKYLSSTTTFKAPTAGLVSFSIGDAALPFSDASLVNLTPGQLTNFTDVKSFDEAAYLKNDEPMAEILDSTMYKIIFVLPAEVAADLVPGGQYQINLSMKEVAGAEEGAKDEEIATELIGFGKTVENRTVVIMQSNVWKDIFSSQIKFPGKVVLGRYDGVLVPAAALTYQDEEQGVFIKAKGDFIFRPVIIVGEDGENIAVSGINAGSVVVTNPERLGKLL
jgi:hypothetical protein